jgi:hypothetical protein
VDLGRGYPFKLYSKEFYRALAIFHTRRLLKGEKTSTSRLIKINTDMKVSDEAFEKENREQGLYRIPRWALAEALGPPPSNMSIASGSPFETKISMEDPVSHKERGFNELDLRAGRYDEQIRAILRIPAIKYEDKDWMKIQLSCSLIAKLPYNADKCKGFVRNEGSIYAQMPDHLSDSMTGLVHTKPIMQPQPLCALVPKFYGLFETENGPPLFLLEDCGKPIEALGTTLTASDK